MKKLSNVSPFLLLLFPVFIMMGLAFVTNNNNQENNVAVVKTTTSGNVIKVATSILK